MWLSDTSLYEVVERSWAARLKGNPIFRICKKLQGAKLAIRDWNKNFFDRIDIKALLVRQNLSDAQDRIARDPCNVGLRSEEKTIQAENIVLSTHEEQLYHQKSRVSWLNLGNSNTSFFHSAISMRRNQNAISVIEDHNGEICTDPRSVEEVLVNHFCALLNHSLTSNGVIPEPTHCLSKEDADMLISPVSSAEIKDVVFHCDGNRAPEPNGFNGAFFKTFWYLVGIDVIEAIQYCFSSGNILPVLNTTFFSLIPKCNGACKPDQLRPICLCNFVYKVITKLMANRLSKVMNSTISPNQPAFIKDRLIQDNVLLTHELCHNFHRDNGVKAMCIKLDLRKAYDDVIHDSLIQFMTKVGFSQINASPKGFFPSSNGLRQGDPLSSLLFCLVKEMLSCSLNSALALDVESVDGILDCLKSFRDISGLEANVLKSEVFITGIHDHLRQVICSKLNIDEGRLPIRYLGLPFITSRLTNQDCQPLLSKIRKRLAMWGNKMLSRAGRLELIKSVLSSFQVYWSGTYNIPATILQDIEKIFRNFFWAGKDQVKLLWHIVNNRKSLWVNWFKLKYLKKKNFWERPMPSKPPWRVRSIFNYREFASSQVCYVIGHGKGINFSTQPWHPNGPICKQTSEGVFFNQMNQATIAGMHEDGSWDQIISFPNLSQLRGIISTGIFLKDSEDQVIWKASPDGKFSLKSAWDQIRTRYSRPAWAKTIWANGHIPRHSLIAWQALNNRLYTRDRLGFLGVNREVATIIRVGFCSAIYKIWEERNKKYHGTQPRHKQQILHSIFSIITSRLSFLQLENPRTQSNIKITEFFGLGCFQASKDVQYCSWHKPPIQFFKLNTDAAIHGDNAGLGGLIRDSSGKEVAACSVRLPAEEIHVLENEGYPSGG
ncbi:uncharacterized protein LOC143883275 [Tasmannia lanceolata]|uniref:uncharacterized protein LOC143875916 n=1 Tax=Tasmannia lanceolata TaxID=3420 RepID=UPI0040646825